MQALLQVVCRVTSGGVNWKPIFDNEVTSSIGAVAIQQSNPDVIWVGTERNQEIV